LRPSVPALVIAMPVEHQPSFYLTEEAAQKRIEKLIDRIARDGLRPGESVPARIMVMADFRRGELRVAA
jgi:hypothetical protein